MAGELKCWDGAGNLIFDGNVKAIKFAAESAVSFDRLYFNVYNGAVDGRSVVTGYAYLNNNGRTYPVSCVTFNGGFYCSLPPLVGIPGWSGGISGTVYYKVLNY